MFGRRSSKNVNGTTTKFVWDGSQLIARYDAQGHELQHYVYGAGNVPIVVEGIGANNAATAYNWFHTDALGSVRATSNAAGNLVNSIGYSPFGQTTSLAASPFQFAGMILDSESGLYYDQARYYSPQQGRFISADPIGAAGGINIYAYAGNDPLNNVDPTGLDFWDDLGNFFGGIGDSFSGIGSDIGNFFNGGNGYDASVSAPDPCATADICVIGTPPTNDPVLNLSDVLASTPNPISPPENITVTGTRPSHKKAPPFIIQIASTTSSAGSETQSGHDYRTQNNVCKRQLSTAEAQDLISRFGVPSVFLAGTPTGNGEHMVTNSLGIPGGFVQTTFSSDGLSVTNVTTPVHAFVGTIVRSEINVDSASAIATHGFGNAGSNPIGEFRDWNNQEFGPGIFNQLDSQAASYATAHFPGC